MSPASQQARLAAAVQDPTQPVPDGVISYRGDADPLRFAVYRNNVHVGLVGVLASKFPVCARLVGDEFFTAMARIYVADHKPATPVMMAYGADFPDFVASFDNARSVPYLADIARLEEAWAIAYNAADQDPLAIVQLAGLEPQTLLQTQLHAHPTCGLIISAFPIGAIWSAHQTSGVTVRPGAQTVLLTRPQADVKVTVIPAADAAFLAGLLRGDAIGAAAEAVLANHSSFDLAYALTGLCALGAFSSSRKG
jgi:hypothetical protein